MYKFVLKSVFVMLSVLWGQALLAFDAYRAHELVNEATFLTRRFEFAEADYKLRTVQVELGTFYAPGRQRLDQALDNALDALRDTRLNNSFIVSVVEDNAGVAHDAIDEMSRRPGTITPRPPRRPIRPIRPPRPLPRPEPVWEIATVRGHCIGGSICGNPSMSVPLPHGAFVSSIEIYADDQVGGKQKGALSVRLDGRVIAAYIDIKKQGSRIKIPVNAVGSRVTLTAVTNDEVNVHQVKVFGRR